MQGTHQITHEAEYEAPFHASIGPVVSENGRLSQVAQLTRGINVYTWMSINRQH